MSTEHGHRAEHGRGRKRDHERTDAILRAAAVLLIELGFDKLRIQDVAERAGTGLGTIYRRWKTKEALLADAIRAFPEPPFETTGDPSADLEAALEKKARFFAEYPDLMPGLIAALRNDENLARAARQRYRDAPLRERFAAVLGQDHPQLDLLAELVTAIPLHRTVFRGRPLDPEAFADEIGALVTRLAPTPEGPGSTEPDHRPGGRSKSP